MPYTLYFHPTPDRLSPHGTFVSEEEWTHYQTFEAKRTINEREAYWYARPSQRDAAAQTLALKRQKAYNTWKRLVDALPAEPA